LIGKRHLKTAIWLLAQSNPEVEANVVWRPHVLLPYTPPEGVDYQDFYVKRLGSAEAVAARRAQVQEAGRAAGIEFEFEQISVLPNTLASHRVIHYAERNGTVQQQETLIEQLYLDYFTRGKNISDQAMLMDTAVRCGFDRAAVENYLDSEEGKDEIMQHLIAAHRRGISGVPGFVFNDSYFVSGAHPPATLLKAMQQVL
jgi:predicted DsbA family dithiol-disulfide isomerase